MFTTGVATAFTPEYWSFSILRLLVGIAAAGGITVGFVICKLCYTVQTFNSCTSRPVGACEKVASDLELGGGFRRVLRFPPPVTTGLSRISCNTADKVMKIEIPIAARADVRQCMVVHTPMDNMSKNKPSTYMTHVACESKMRSVVRLSMHPHSANWVVIKRAVVYYPRDAYTFSGGIKCWHCIFILESHNTGKSLVRE